MTHRNIGLEVAGERAALERPPPPVVPAPARHKIAPRMSQNYAAGSDGRTYTSTPLSPPLLILVCRKEGLESPRTDTLGIALPKMSQPVKLPSPGGGGSKTLQKCSAGRRASAPQKPQNTQRSHIRSIDAPLSVTSTPASAPLDTAHAVNLGSPR